MTAEADTNHKPRKWTFHFSRRSHRLPSQVRRPASRGQHSEPDRIALDFKNIADEVIAHLREQGTELVVKIEIEATDITGFAENTVRTVSENARTLKFDQSGFEES